MENFVNLLRIPDDVKIKTPSTPLRFEEKGIANPVKAEVRFEIGDSLKVILEASEPVEWIRLRFDGDLRGVKSVLGDAVERCTANDLIWWQCSRTRACLGISTPSTASGSIHMA